MKLYFKRKLAGLLSALMAFSIIMGGQSAALVTVFGGNDVIEVNFTDGSVNGNVITYTVGEQSVMVTVNGADVSDSKITVPRGNEESVTFTLSDNYSADTMEVKLYADDGFNATLNVTNYITSLKQANADGLPNAPLKLVVAEKGNGGGGGEPGQPGDNGGGASHEFNYPDRADAALNTTGDAEFYINGVSGQDRQYDEETHMDIVTQKTSITYPYDVNSANVEFEFVTLINERYTSIKINGVDYSSYIPGYTSGENSKTDAQIEAEVLEAIDLNGNSQTVSVIIASVPKADSYKIEVSRKEITSEDSVYWPVGNFLWNSQESPEPEVGESDCIKGGKIQLVSVKYNGVSYSDEAGAVNRLTGEGGLLGSRCYFEWYEFMDNEGNLIGDGGAVFPYGTELTIKLIPDYGRQLVAFGVNGGVFTCGESVSTYTFTVARGNFHLNARFEDVADEVSASGSNEVSSGSITLGANEIETGTVVLTVDDTTPSSAEQTEFANAADGYTVDSYLDLNLNQVVYKGRKTDYWSNDMSTLNSAAAVSLELSNKLTSSDVEIIHQKHDGTYEVIPAAYDAAANTVTFNTSSFSKYAIAYKSDASDNQNGLVIGADGSIKYYENGKESNTFTGMATDSTTGKKYWFDDGVAARSKEVYDSVSNGWYWFDADGTMATNKDANLPDGTPLGKWVRYDENGIMVKGEDYRYGGWYRFDEITGAMIKGWYTTNDEKIYYYNDITGQMEHGAVVIGGENYAFDDVTGIGVDCSWYSIDGNEFWYEDAKRQGMEGRGKEIYDAASDAWYWLDSIDGGKKAVSKDVYQESWAGIYGDNGEYGKWVRYDENGHMIKGWDKQNGNTYYFDMITGAMVKGTTEIDGVKYTFDMATGILVE